MKVYEFNCNAGALTSNVFFYDIEEAIKFTREFVKKHSESRDKHYNKLCLIEWYLPMETPIGINSKKDMQEWFASFYPNIGYKEKGFSAILGAVKDVILHFE